MEVRGQLHAPATLSPGKEPLVSVGYRRPGGLQSRSGRGEEKNSQPLPRIESLIIQPAAQRYTTVLSRLHIECPVTLFWYFRIIFLRPFADRNITMNMDLILNGFGDIGI
jgi:hypothetical protein